MLVRARNLARAKEVAPIAMDDYPNEDAMVVRDFFFFEQMTDHEEFLVWLVALTPRPSTILIAEAATTIFCDIASPSPLAPAPLPLSRPPEGFPVRDDGDEERLVRQRHEAVCHNGEESAKSSGSIGQAAQRAVQDSEHLGAVVGGRAARVSLHGSFARRSDFWRRFRRRTQRMDAQPPIELIRVWCGTLLSASPSATSLAARSSKDDLAQVLPATDETRLEAFLTPEGVKWIHIDAR